MTNINDFIDVNGLIKPHKAWRDSGNGLLYTTIYNCLVYKDQTKDFIFYSDLWRWNEGVLWRTPTNGFGQESHDNYLAFAVDCHMHMQYALDVPRAVLWSSFKKLGFMQNSFEKGDLWKSQMLRFPNVWIIMIAAAYPSISVKFICRQLLWALVKLNSVNVGDASGLQLRWLNLYAIKLMGNSKPIETFMRQYDMSQIMNGYYDSDHCILEGFRNYKP